MPCLFYTLMTLAMNVSASSRNHRFSVCTNPLRKMLMPPAQ